MKPLLALLPLAFFSCASVTSDRVLFCYPQSVKPVDVGWNYWGSVGVDTSHGILPKVTDPKELVVRIEDKNGRVLLNHHQSSPGDFRGGDVEWNRFPLIVFRLKFREYVREPTTLILHAKFDPAENLFHLQQ